MNRSIRVALVVAIAALTIPTVALATQGDGAHNSHGHSHHGRSAPAGTGAGTVTSYSDGTLVVALEDGGSITGSVTRDTRFECQNADQGHRRAVFAAGGHRCATGATSATGATGVTGDTGATGATSDDRRDRRHRLDRLDRLDRTDGSRRAHRKHRQRRLLGPWPWQAGALRQLAADQRRRGRQRGRPARLARRVVQRDRVAAGRPIGNAARTPARSDSTGAAARRPPRLSAGRAASPRSP